MDSREQFRRVASNYDSLRRVRLGEGLRRQAFAEFDLRMGDVVLDVGCGTGLSFPLIEEAIGSSGSLVGVDQSPEMLALAQARVNEAGWTNVTLLEAPVDEVSIPCAVDVLIFFRVHDVLRTVAALEHVFVSAKPGARVLAVGPKWAPWWAFPVNLAIWLGVRKVTTTREGFRRPWEKLERFVPDLHVRSIALGAHYVATGTKRSD